MADSTAVRARLRRHRHAASVGAPVLAALLLGACEPPMVHWLDRTPVATTQPSPLAYGPDVPVDSALPDSSALAAFQREQDVLREAGAAKLVATHLDSVAEARQAITANATMPAMAMAPAPGGALGTSDAPRDPARCARSLRVTTAPGRGAVAVWWTRRERGRVSLVAAWRDGVGTTAGGTTTGDTTAGDTTAGGADSTGAGHAPWRGPIVIDSLDQGPSESGARVAGCARPAPSVVVDDTHGYVHVAYALTGPEGAGVFYAHQMDPRSAFEPPRAIVYGDGIGAVRVAAAGDVVAVAYEDPNSPARSRIGLALSRTSGHLFEDRLTASADNADARDPHVAVRGRAVAVGWSELAPGGGTPRFVIRRAIVR